MQKPITVARLQSSSVEHIKAWIHQLEAQQALWHFDDHPDNIIWSQGHKCYEPTEVFTNYNDLVTDYEAVMTYCEANDIDVFELYPINPLD